MAGMFEPFEKRLTPIVKAAKGMALSASALDREELAHYIEQFPLQMEELVDQIADLISGGSTAETFAEFEKSRDVRVWSNTLRTTYSMIKGGMGARGNTGKAANAQLKELKKLAEEFKKLAPKAVSGDDKKKVKEIEATLKDTQKTLVAAAPLDEKAGKFASDLLKLPLEKHFSAGIAEAEKRPRKKIKELPDDFNEAAFSKKEKELKARLEELKEMPKLIEKLKTEGEKDVEKNLSELKKDLFKANKTLVELNFKKVPDPGPKGDKEAKKSFGEWTKNLKDGEAAKEKAEKGLKDLNSDVQNSAKAKQAKLRKYIDSLDEAYLELKNYAASLQKAEKEFGIALKASKHVKMFGEHSDRATKLSKEFKAQHKKYSKVEFQEDVKDFD